MIMQTQKFSNHETHVESLLSCDKEPLRTVPFTGMVVKVGGLIGERGVEPSVPEITV